MLMYRHSSEYGFCGTNSVRLLPTFNYPDALANVTLSSASEAAILGVGPSSSLFTPK